MEAGGGNKEGNEQEAYYFTQKWEFNDIVQKKKSIYIKNYNEEVLNMRR